MSPIRSALVTGSTDPSGLGFTAALLLAKTGAFSKILLSGRRKDTAEVAAKELQSKLPTDSPTQIGYLVLDVTSSQSIADAAQTLSSPDGPLGAQAGVLDVLVNNAGIGAPPGRLSPGEIFLKTDVTIAQDIVTVMATNVGAVVELTNALLPLLAKSSAPRVVNTSSARGSLAFTSGLPAERTGALVYNASKAALNMTTVMQSLNLPHAAQNSNLKVNAASPGHVKTQFNGFTGARTPEAGAGAIVYLAILPNDGISQLVGDHPLFSEKEGDFVQIPW
ncbi:hypothetical protein HWV62_11812 [Athelia sp. TMB]|nr:hypothetical protein HWV62_11812 [Athelia sp. TMB]